MKSIVITGVSSGIGYGACTEFINRGYRVFGSVRKIKDARRLRNEFGDSFEPLLFDLTDHAAIQKEAARVTTILEGQNLTGLINNAGETQAGPLLHIPIEEVRKSFEVLVIGQLVVIQSFFPLLKVNSVKNHKPGRIVMISSTSGKLGFPFIGTYAGSKHALEGISKSLRVELQLYGIEVVVIGPGNIDTAIWDKHNLEIIDQYCGTDYQLPLQKMHLYLKKIIPSESIKLSIFSKKLANIFEAKRPKSRYVIVKNSFQHWVITHLISEKIRNKIVAQKLGLKPTPGYTISFNQSS